MQNEIYKLKLEHKIVTKLIEAKNALLISIVVVVVIFSEIMSTLERPPRVTYPVIFCNPEPML